MFYCIRENFYNIAKNFKIFLLSQIADSKKRKLFLENHKNIACVFDILSEYKEQRY